jgi:hypothetical protein
MNTYAVTLVLNRLRSGIGTGESPRGSNNNFIVEWYNEFVERIGRGPWCQMTVTWSHFTTLPKRLIKGRAYTVWACDDFRERFANGIWTYGTKGMQPGDIVYYDWGGSKRTVAYVDHVGTVEKVDSDGTFYVLEGNIGDRLQRMHRDAKYVVGYGRPDWSQIPVPKPKTVPPPYPYELHRGSRNRYVKRVQSRLNTRMSPNPHLTADGDYGPATEAAVRHWQSQHRALDVDGVVGPMTWQSIFA